MLNIIIPAYNCSETLPKTLASLVSQTYKGRFIVTIVDDCSTEELKPIVDHFSEYLTIKYIKSEKNKGVGITRQIGIDNCPKPCDYIMFIDSDDMIMPYTVELFMREIRQNNPEVISSLFIQDQRVSLFPMEREITWTHGKCYSKKFLNKYNIKVPPVRLNEDAGFNVMVFELATNKKYIEKETYLWNFNVNSLTRSDSEFFINCLSDYIKSIDFALQTIKQSKDLRTNARAAKLIVQIYYYYQMALYHNFCTKKDIEINIYNLFTDNNIKEIIEDKDFNQLITNYLLNLIPDCQVGEYRCVQTFEDFIKEFTLNI